MKIYDMHVHIYSRTKYVDKPDPHATVAAMETAGIYGGCVFSNYPQPSHPTGTPFETRLEELFQWTQGYEGRLFPILWIHPDEENILEKMEIAVKRGVMGFKIICNNFYVYEEKCMNLLRKSAELNKPVFFHSGILWDNQVGSVYNRPLNWEHLLPIRGLRFSMGHCAWPWTDECLALYGEFKHTPMYKDGAEMFLDLTPGPPEIYRRDLLTKFYKIGFDVEHNVLFGTDCSADHYNPDYAKKWLTVDGTILDELEIGEEKRKLMYQDNLMRFLGINNNTKEEAI